MSDRVVLLHGILRTHRSMRPMEQALEKAGYDVLNLGYDSRRKSLDQIAGDVSRALDARGPPADGRVHLVTHSMGGLVARVLIARDRPEHLGRVVMLGPPNGGSEVADRLSHRTFYRVLFGPAGQQLTTIHADRMAEDLPPVDYPLGIIAGTRSVNWLSSALILRGPNDGRVTVLRTRLPGMADHLVVREAHPFLMRNPVVIRQTLAFLRHGRFTGDPTTGWPT